ncbi:alpha-hydroxy acid oxidase [Aspergillus glaucus CBS 516.65]|uniref:Oxidase FUB9 n=1 Tax=Aspergillus glaucus CBS 516.65 TaxID=1160497 RepID=A0A1L9V5J0_ASPGL|nr:hypothetical protein ASPGLDRAFT_137261 [Aspergillus glaucus CBS 516.65]OJJ79194.1 hypothetical protein ASPGLDRAFT_137261 [Aspergillus glaucus CBS 516.65]
MADSTPTDLPLTVKDIQDEAKKKLPQLYRYYFNEGAGEMVSLRDNENAFARYKLRPRVLRDVEEVDTTTEIFRTKVSFPLGFAPAAAHRLAHSDAERGTSRAASHNGIAMCLSTWSTTSPEEVIAQSSGNPYAMQVSFFKDIEVTRCIIKRAEAAGYKALFVSVDLPVIGSRRNEQRNKWAFPSHIGFPSLQGATDDLMATYAAGYDASIRWDKIIPWLRKTTKMEIWLKGVSTAEDVQLAIEHEVDGVVISNHGGRQLDGQPATLDALRECGPVARGRIPLAIDGGIRSGADIFKALALGASMCFVGRIPIWGLAYNGEAGVDIALKILLEEFRHTMKFMGCRTIQDINPSHLSLLQMDGRLAKL